MYLKLNLKTTARSDFIVSVGFLLLLLFTILAYWPGLESQFILDDEPNLSPLSNINSYRESEEHQQYAITRFWLYVSEGITGRLGRPLSLISFALQAPNWPTNPWAFKYVNLMIHLINGCLVMFISLRLTRAMRGETNLKYFIALTATAFWLLHPLHVGTVLYVVQRMTELSALFTFAGLAAYVHGRLQINETLKSNIVGLTWMSAGILCGLIFGILSKENAILIVIYALAIEYTCLQKIPKPRFWNLWKIIFLLLPFILLIGYLIVDVNSSILKSYNYRDFTLKERLLTEPRIIWEYILKIIVPTPNNFSLFHDNYPISKSLTQPISTLFSICLLVSLILSAIWLRKKTPVYSFAVFFYLGGHLLESTVIGLELYFDHRNYLPAFGIHYALAYSILLGIINTNKTSLKLLLLIFIFTLICLLSFITYKETKLWSQPHVQAVTWLYENPQSKRARINAANSFLSVGRPDRALELLDSVIRDWPNEASAYAHKLHISCIYPEYKYIPKRSELLKLQNSEFDGDTLSALQSLTESYERSACSELDIYIVIDFIKHILLNENYKPEYSGLHFVLGKLYSIDGSLDTAIKELDKSYNLESNIFVAMNQAQWLASAKLYDDAIHYLDKAKAAITGSALKEKLYIKVLNEWKRDILLDKRLHIKKQEP